jgi:hypothetical protein
VGALPVTQPLLSVELKDIVKADAQPPIPEGYEVVLIKDLTYTKLWLIYKIIQ